ncbi:MAG TPA: glycosyltransferase [Bryobacteraceae bacterium]|nr:glycosyltransferase [Bryobacteraceae bacterium]
MRILIDAANCRVGGGAAAQHLLRALDSRETAIEMIALVPAVEAFDLRLQRIRLIRLPVETSLLWWKWERARAQAAAETGRVDIYHALTCQAPPKGIRADAVITSFTNSNPYTRRRAGWRLRDRIRLAILRRRFRANLQRATHVVAHTAAAKALLADVVPACGKPVMVHRLGVETLSDFQYDARLMPGSCILCPSSYLPHKNLERLLRAYDLCCRSVDAPPLIVAGFVIEPYHSRLERIRRSLHSAAFIQLLGEQSGAGMADLYRRAVAVAVPSYEETFSLPVMEALAARIPVLCSDPGGSYWLPYREFEPGLIYWDCFSIESIAGGLSRIIRSEDERRRVSAILRSNQAHRSWNDYAHELLQCYLDLIPQTQTV